MGVLQDLVRRASEPLRPPPQLTINDDDVEPLAAELLDLERFDPPEGVTRRQQLATRSQMIRDGRTSICGSQLVVKPKDKPNEEAT